MEIDLSCKRNSEFKNGYMSSNLKLNGYMSSNLKLNVKMNDLNEADIKMTIRLHIVYSKLNIRSIRNDFQESVGNRLKKFGGLDNDGLLQSFTSLFKDEYKIPRSSTIDLTKEPGHVLSVAIEGNNVGSVKSKLLCKSILDLYIGEEPFDKNAREDFLDNVVSLAGN